MIKESIRTPLCLAAGLALLAGCASAPPAHTPPPPQAKNGVNDSVVPPTAQAQSGPQAGIMPGDQIGKTTTVPSTTAMPAQQQVAKTVVSQVPSLRVCTEKADINRMDVFNFMAFGFPPEQAQAIVNYRNSHGPFHSIDELAAVDGVDARIVDLARPDFGVATATG